MPSIITKTTLTLFPLPINFNTLTRNILIFSPPLTTTNKPSHKTTRLSIAYHITTPNIHPLPIPTFRTTSPQPVPLHLAHSSLPTFASTNNPSIPVTSQAVPFSIQVSTPLTISTTVSQPLAFRP